MIDPETGLIIFIVSGIIGIATFAITEFAVKVGPKLEPRDLLPLPPWEGPPLPRFTKTKPEVIEALRRM